MIPKILRLKNFLSYGNKEEVVDFGPYPLICLNGKNGHGKSALLDAMTWALWGQARKTSGTAKPDSQLLHLGQTFMAVSFDFMFNDQLYRVRREHAKTYGDAHAALDFGIVNEATGQVSSLTDKTIKKTQEKIIATIGLDYDAFINTAFLRQGQANEFSKKSPKDRKDLLANILSLDQLDEIRKRASEKHKELLAASASVHQWVERIAKELETEPTVIQELRASNEKIEALAHQEKKLKADLEQTQKEREAALAKQVQLEKDKLILEERLSSEETYTSKLRATYTLWKARHKMFLTVAQQETIQQRKHELVTALQQHQEKLQKTLTLKEQQLLLQQQQEKIKKEVEERAQKELQKQSKLSHEMALLTNTADQQKKQIAQRIQSYQEDINQFNQESTILEQQKQHMIKQVEQHRGASEQFEKRKTAYHGWAARLKLLEHEAQELGKKTEWVMHEQNPNCPLCEQNLSAARKRFLKTKFSKTDDRLLHQKKRLTQALKKLKSLLLEQHAQLEHVRILTGKIEQLNTQQASLKKMAEKTELLQKQQGLLLAEAEKKYAQCRAEQDLQEKLYQEITEQLTNAPQKDVAYQEKEREISALELNLKTNLYDQKAHQAVQQEIETLQQHELFLLQAQQHAAEQSQRRQEIKELLRMLRTLKKERLLLATKLQEWKELLDIIQQAQNNISSIQKEYDLLLKDREVQAHERGKLQQQKSKLEQLEKERQASLEKIKLVQAEADDYYTIATAMGKDGIQALLIEDALPEIEHETNVLLSELTDNQAHVIIESLRDLKKGGTKETLDIKISDPAGIRPYEMFSGGEAFRIDFALRIAISKLLARRAGTSLQTLIIDEGFGSQDDEGLAHITQALHKIQDHFKKIIIVSHLTAMKDQFPVHFYVEKRGNSSHVQVIEQD